MNWQGLLRGLGNIFNVLIALFMGAAVLWLVGELDANAAAAAGAHHAAALRGWVAGLPWRGAVVVLLFLLVLGVFMAAWGRIRYLIETRRPTSVKVMD